MRAFVDFLRHRSQLKASRGAETRVPALTQAGHRWRGGWEGVTNGKLHRPGFLLLVGDYLLSDPPDLLVRSVLDTCDRDIDRVLAIGA